MKLELPERLEQSLGKKLEQVASTPYFNQASKISACSDLLTLYLGAVLKDEQDVSVFQNTVDERGPQILTGKGLCSELDKMRAESPKNSSIYTGGLHGKILELMVPLDIENILNEFSRIPNQEYVLNNSVDFDLEAPNLWQSIDMILSKGDPDIHL